MDNSRPVFKLLVITFLDSVCYGLLYGFLSPYVLSLGGDHVVVGTLTVGNLICSLVSADLINNLTQIHGKKNSLFLVFLIAMLSHMFMIASNSYWCTIFARYIFSITNQSQNLCKDLLLQNTPTDEQDYYLTRYSILSGAGFVIGPFISGYLYSIGFVYDALFAATLTFVNTCLIMSIPTEEDDMPQGYAERNFLMKSGEKVDDAIHNLLESEYQENWDIMAIKFLYISSISIFFSKFTQILKHNFNATPIVIGYTSAYMNSLTFVGQFFAPNIKDRCSKYSTVVLAKYALIVSGATLLFACYSPVYGVYALMCIPVIFSTSFLNSIWQDIFKSRGNDSLVKTNTSMGVLAGLTIPLIFGIICNVIGHHAVIIFSVIPILASIFIINKFTELYKLSKKEVEKSKDK